MQTLRVGICGCTDRFHGVFEGVVFTIVPQRYTHARPLRFRLAEAIIPEEGDQCEALRRLRCHFFLDQHLVSWKPPLETNLTRNHLVSNGVNRRAKFYRAGGFGRIGSARYWETKRSPKAQTIVRAMQAMLQQWDLKQLQRWLRNMEQLV